MAAEEAPPSEVSGTVGRRLVDAIDAGDVERPSLMRWNAFQTWRSERGSNTRPTTRVDGFTTDNAFERRLYEAVMEHLYGPTWGTQVLQAERNEEEVAEAARAHTQQGEPSGPPAVYADWVSAF